MPAGQPIPKRAQPRDNHHLVQHIFGGYWCRLRMAIARLIHRQPIPASTNSDHSRSAAQEVDRYRYHRRHHRSKNQPAKKEIMLTIDGRYGGKRVRRWLSFVAQHGLTQRTNRPGSGHMNLTFITAFHAAHLPAIPRRSGSWRFPPRSPFQ